MISKYILSITFFKGAWAPFFAQLNDFTNFYQIPIILFAIIHLFEHCLMLLFTNPSARAGYDTRSIFKRSLTGLNSEFSFS